ncbi:MAG: mannose-6-phosphate isomerase, class I [Propionibacteriaceae bacterium]|nr:mannose-6-phosphate isomerase, class I [Propionibacteriaceae bacterium]
MLMLTGTLQDYAWGSHDGIPAALGTEPTGSPQAEYWLGAHPKAPSRLADGRSLDAVLTERPELIGAVNLDRFGPRLPFLMKLISARQALSLQAHPSRAQAIEGFDQENRAGIALDAPERNYRDDWPKPEALVALTEFHGLCGFRDPSQTQALAAHLGVPTLDLLFQPLIEGDGIARVLLEILGIADLEDDLLPDVVAAAREHAGADSELGRFCDTIVELDRDYPGDPGILAAMLLNRILLQPGDSFFMPAGNLHAYLRGTALEVMSNSDNVLRGGLTPKHIDVDELAQVVDFMPGFPGLIDPVEVSLGIWHYPTEAPEFVLYRVDDASDQPLPGAESARILLALQGEVRLVGAAGELVLGRGEAAFLAAGEEVRVHSTGQAFMVGSALP